MYTDGSKSGNGSGAGIVVETKCNNHVNFNTYKIKLNPLASIFSAELVAKIHPLLYILIQKVLCKQF